MEDQGILLQALSIETQVNFFKCLDLSIFRDVITNSTMCQWIKLNSS